MPVRWYLPPTSAAPPNSPTPNASVWNDVTSFTRVIAPTAKSSATPATQSIVNATATGGTTILFKQFHTDTLPVGTVFTTAQNFRGHARCSEAGATNNLRTQCLVTVYNGTTIKANLGGPVLPSVSGNPTSEFSTTLTNRYLTWTATHTIVTNYTTVAGDYLVFDLGCGKQNTVSVTANMRWTDNAATDLSDDEAGTADLNSWFEWSGDFPAVGVRRVQQMIS